MFKAQNFLLKSSNEFRIFTIKILYHLFILKKRLTFPISNRNKSDDKKLTIGMFTILPMFFETVQLVFENCAWPSLEQFSTVNFHSFP